MAGMRTPRSVDDFPKKGNHIGDLIRLPSGQVYEWTLFKRWQRNTREERLYNGRSLKGSDV